LWRDEVRGGFFWGKEGRGGAGGSGLSMDSAAWLQSDIVCSSNEDAHAEWGGWEMDVRMDASILLNLLGAWYCTVVLPPRWMIYSCAKDVEEGCGPGRAGSGLCGGESTLGYGISILRASRKNTKLHTGRSRIF